MVLLINGKHLHNDFMSAIEDGQLNAVKQTSYWLDLMILKKDYSAFLLAATCGHLDIIKWLIDQTTGANQKKVVEANNFQIFSDAAKYGHIHIMKWLISFSTEDDIKKMIKAKSYKIFTLAAEAGQIDIMKWLLTLIPNINQDMITSRGFEALFHITVNGPTDFEALLLGFFSKEESSYLNRELFLKAASSGNLHVMEKLLTRSSKSMMEKLMSLDFKDILAEVYFNAFIKAIENGHLNVIERLIALASKTIINPHGFFRIDRVFKCDAAQNGHLSVMQRLIEIFPDKTKQLIKSGNWRGKYLAFREAAENGHLHVMAWLMTISTQSMQQEMIESCRYGAFRKAAANGHLNIVEWLVALAPQKIPDMIVANKQLDIDGRESRGYTDHKTYIESSKYQAFHDAIQNGHLEVAKRLVSLASAVGISEMINAKDRCGNASFYNAACHGHLQILKWLTTLYSANERDIQEAFKSAVFHGNIEIMHYLIALSSEDTAGLILDFDRVIKYGNLDTLRYLLSLYNVFSHIEMHEQEYSQYTHAFISEQLHVLHTQKTAAESNNSLAIFDITNISEAKLCFYMLRNLIRRNDSSLLDDIRFLLNIPSVQALLHTAVTPNQPNELLRLALSMENQAAAEIFLTVPMVHALAEQHDFYRREARGGLDINALVRDHESSMTALTSGEQKRLDAAIKLYQPVIKERGIDSLISELRDLLIARYQENPAQVQTGDGRVIDLPASWDTWCALRETLSADTRERAMEAYAQHKDHSAWRYLEKPNPWMADDAPYVNRDARGADSRFEGYKPLIAMFFLGASDENTAPCDGHTLETRVEHFIDDSPYARLSLSQHII